MTTNSFSPCPFCGGSEADCCDRMVRSLSRPPAVRCAICGWPLAASVREGCVAESCSYRPEQGSDEWYRIKARREALATPAPGTEQEPIP